MYNWHDSMFSQLSLVRTPVFVVDPETQLITDANLSARKIFGEGLEGKNVTALLDLSESALHWYHSLNRTDNPFVFLPFIFNEESMVLDSFFLDLEEKTVRIDTLCPIDDQDPISYYSKLEISFQMINGTGKISQEGTDIKSILSAALFIYAADRAFVIEFDPVLECVADIFSLSRTGFDSEIGNVRSTDSDGIGSLTNAWDTGQTIYLEKYSKCEQQDILTAQLYSGLDEWPTMLAPFRKASGIRCFLCIDNMRRFGGVFSALNILALLIENTVFADKLQNESRAARSLSNSISHIPESLVKIYMLGGLKVQTSYGVISNDSSFSSQCGLFFTFLVLNHKRVVSIREIADVLWPDEIIDNPYNLVKNIAFRTRKIFDGICSKPIIVAGNGSYSINKDLDYWIDIEEFEKLCRKAGNVNLSTEERLLVCKKATDLYIGGMLPLLDGELWLSSRISYYQVLFQEMIYTYTDLLKNTGDIKEMLNVIAHADMIDPVDGDVYITALDALIEAKQYSLAKSYYSNVKNRLSKEQKLHFRSMYRPE